MYAVGTAFLAAGAYFTYIGFRYSDPTLMADMIKLRFEPSTLNDFLIRHPNVDIVKAATDWAVTLYCAGGLITSVRAMMDEVPNKISSKAINPMREWAGRHLRANYLAELGYNGI
jgi:hypothetical protein